MMNEWKDRNVLIVGAARQGLALARFLVRQGAHVTLNDVRPPQEMQAAQKKMQDYEIVWELGHHSPDLLQGKDQLCVSGGVPLTLSLIQEALQKGIPLSNDSQIFMQTVPCKVIGVTGSAGKTTTTTLLGRMAENAVVPPQKAWIGGNIGVPLIDHVGQIGVEDIVILEFSSFQLELMDRSPQISAILNITPNHLDRHGTMEVYASIKSRIFQFQGTEDWTILGADDPTAWQLREQVPGKLGAFSLDQKTDIPGAFVQDKKVVVHDKTGAREVIPVEEIDLRGEHNVLNVLAACSIAQAAGFSSESMRAGISGFSGVPHRLEFVRRYRGADWYNGSKATTPESAMVAIRSFEEPKVVLLGGRDKKLPWDRLASLAHQIVDHVIAFGEAADIVVDALSRVDPAETGMGKNPTIGRCPSLHDAVLKAAEIAEPGDVVILAPGGTSFDEFNNYEERGEYFKEWVNTLS